MKDRNASKIETKLSDNKKFESAIVENRERFFTILKKQDSKGG